MRSCAIPHFWKNCGNWDWIDGQNIRVDVRWAAGDANLVRKYAAELIALTPDVIVSVGSLSADTLLRSSSSVPIVFTIVLDPVGAGFVKSLSRPGGNITGFMQFEYSLSAKWPELLKQIVPTLTRAAVLRDTSAAAIGQFAVIQSVAPSLGVEAIPITLGDATDIEREIEAFARPGNGGLIVAAAASAVVHRNLINMLAIRHKLPAIYNERSFVTSGGLVCTGQVTSTNIGARHTTSTASSRARSRPIFRCRRRPSTSWSSI